MAGGPGGLTVIYYVSTARFSGTVRGLLKGFRRELGDVVCSLTYEELFFERAGPIGHYIFTDFDRLSRYELECAAAFVSALEQAAPQARILNHPLRALERYPLLVALYKAGINDFTATRIDGEERPPRYPVFIRAEDGYAGPDTDLLHDDADFDAAVERLAVRGLPRRGRIAVGYAGEAGPDGFFRKYAAYGIAGRILPHHLQRNRGWVVKKDVPAHEWAVARDRSDRLATNAVDEEIAFVRDNPHHEVLQRAFSVANIDFGRADYAIIGGHVRVYEINTNPSLPGIAKVDSRDGVRVFTRPRIVEAFRAIDAPIAGRGRVQFTEQRPRAHDVRLPWRRMPVSLMRQAMDLLRPRMNTAAGIEN